MTFSLDWITANKDSILVASNIDSRLSIIYRYIFQACEVHCHTLLVI
jgi:hypothetical protein